MTILETQSVIVTPAPAPPLPPTASQGPPPAPPPPARQRSRRWSIGALAVMAAAGLATAVWSPWSSTAPTTPERLAPPSYVRLVGVTPSMVVIRWSPPLTDSSVVGYEILRNGVVSDMVTPVQSTYNATGLATGRTYRFEV